MIFSATSDAVQTALVTLASVAGVAIAGGSWRLATTLGQLSKTVELLDQRLERLEKSSH